MKFAFFLQRKNNVNKRLFLIPYALCILLINNNILYSHQFEIGEISINHPYIRFEVSSGPAAGYMTIVNRGKQLDRLIKVESSFAEKVELHQTRFNDDQVMMKKTLHIDIQPEKAQLLKPDGYHIMFTNLKKKLIEGENLNVILQFERAGQIEVIFTVEGFSESLEQTSH